MPIIVDQRAFGSFVSRADTGSTGTSPRMEDSATFLELTYGLRTGKRAGDNQTDERDVYSPPKGASVHEMLDYRKKFIERAVTKASLNPNSTAPTHFLLSDMGNEFANYRFRARASTNRIRYGTSSSYGSTYWNAVPFTVYSIQPDGSHKAGGCISDLGGFISSKPQSSFVKTNGGVAGITLSDARLFGQQDIAILNPIKSHASVLTTLLELVRGDVPGVLKQLRAHLKTINTLRTATARGVKGAASAVGGSYLENVFGWAPIMRDINNAMQVLTELDHLLFPPESTRRLRSRELVNRQQSTIARTNLSVYGLMNPTGTGNATPRFQINRRSQSGTTSPTPSGAFMDTIHASRETIDIRTTVRFQTNLIPTASNNGYVDRLRDLLGLKLTPEVIWELTPWSWLIDWFSNIGLVVENLSNLHASNLILNYAYSTICREAVDSSVTSRPALTSASTGYRTWEGDVVTKYETWQKVRLKASPYGFATTLNSLTGSQWAILVALGLARQR